MERQRIDIDSLILTPVKAWGNEWLLLAAGDYTAGDYNMMTVAWGGLGVMWNRPVAYIVVRPTRHTILFTEKYDGFTLSHFPADKKGALQYCGSHSGRDVDKVKETGLSPTRGETTAAPVFAEADLTLECKKIYRTEFRPEQFLDKSIEDSYQQEDYHTLYIGEISAAFGRAEYSITKGE